MSDTAARLLALLSLLQSRPDWSGTELAGRLGVSTRTIRNDIDRLRELDYPVDATGIVGIQESRARALAKLEQVLPSRLRPMVTAIGAVVDRAPENIGTDAPDPEVDPAVLAAIP